MGSAGLSPQHSPRGHRDPSPCPQDPRACPDTSAKETSGPDWRKARQPPPTPSGPSASSIPRPGAGARGRAPSSLCTHWISGTGQRGGEADAHAEVISRQLLEQEAAAGPRAGPQRRPQAPVWTRGARNLMGAVFSEPPFLHLANGGVTTQLSPRTALKALGGAAARGRVRLTAQPLCVTLGGRTLRACGVRTGAGWGGLARPPGDSLAPNTGFSPSTPQTRRLGYPQAGAVLYRPALSSLPGLCPQPCSRGGHNLSPVFAKHPREPTALSGQPLAPSLRATEVQAAGRSPGLGSQGPS